MCYRCRRVRRLCVCGIVRGVVGDAPVRNRLGITILQDRKEALKRPFGSAIVCELALENCTSVWYDTKVPETVPFPEHLRETRGVGVLFPGPGARRLRRGRAPRDAKEDAARRENRVGEIEEDASDASDASDAEVPTHLIVIDTTWHRARRMYARIPWIKTLPAYVLGESTPLIRSGDDDNRDSQRKKNQNEAFPFHVNGAELELDRVSQSDDVGQSDDGDPHVSSIRLESGYRIRKQPKPGFLSTAECVAAALREGEPDDEEKETAFFLGNVFTKKETSGAARGARAAAAVEACFDEMIDAQVRSFSDRKNVRYRSRKAERAAKEAAKEVKAGATEGAETTASASASKNAW